MLHSGCPWQDLPRRYGGLTTVWRRITTWPKDGCPGRLRHPQHHPGMLAGDCQKIRPAGVRGQDRGGCASSRRPTRAAAAPAPCGGSSTGRRRRAGPCGRPSTGWGMSASTPPCASSASYRRSSTSARRRWRWACWSACWRTGRSTSSAARATPTTASPPLRYPRLPRPLRPPPPRLTRAHDPQPLAGLALHSQNARLANKVSIDSSDHQGLIY